MLLARIDRLEINARRTAAAIADRREVLDFYANLRREREATLAAAQAEADITLPLLEPEVENRYPRGYARPHSTTCATPNNFMAGDADNLLPSMGRSSSAPGTRRTLMPVHKRETMHERLNKAKTGAQRNARELADRRQVIDDFKAMKGESQNPGALVFSMTDAVSPYATFRSTSVRSNLSQTSCSNFAEKFSLRPFSSAVKERAPPMALKSGSMRTRLDACEHRALWNHQAMTHHQEMIEEKKAEKEAQAKADLRIHVYKSIFD